MCQLQHKRDWQKRHDLYTGKMQMNVITITTIILLNNIMYMKPFTNLTGLYAQTTFND